MTDICRRPATPAHHDDEIVFSGDHGRVNPTDQAVPIRPGEMLVCITDTQGAPVVCSPLSPLFTPRTLTRLQRRIVHAMLSETLARLEEEDQ